MTKPAHRGHGYRDSSKTPLPTLQNETLAAPRTGDSLKPKLVCIPSKGWGQESLRGQGVEWGAPMLVPTCPAHLLPAADAGNSINQFFPISGCKRGEISFTDLMIQVWRHEASWVTHLEHFKRESASHCILKPPLTTTCKKKEE